MASEYNLIDSDQKMLQTIIHLGLNNGAIKDTDIIYHQGIIEEISGLHYDPKVGKFIFVSEFPVKTRSRPSTQNKFVKDAIYFSATVESTEKNRKFKGFVGEFEKYKRDSERQKAKSKGISKSTSQETERAVISPLSVEYREKLESMDSLRSPFPDDEILEDEMTLIPDSSLLEMDLTNCNPLLSPKIKLPIFLEPPDQATQATSTLNYQTETSGCPLLLIIS
jgi:hypothetical protein